MKAILTTLLATAILMLGGCTTQSQPKPATDANSSSDSTNNACTDTVGATKAAEYVRQCLEVSPATHPPCNADNACALIIDEIRRGCSIIGKDAPAYCAQYIKAGGA
jgi:hypothetical protein